ncbi:hypothetical protein LPJGGPFB_04847 [Ensifer adhaerens]|nr:hypothetical protein [Ensifer adhaerens]
MGASDTKLSSPRQPWLHPAPAKGLTFCLNDHLCYGRYQARGNLLFPNRLGGRAAVDTLQHNDIGITAMYHQTTREHHSKAARDWNTRYDLDEFIRAHGLQPMAARALFMKFGPYKIDLDRKVAELRSGQSSVKH